MFDEEVLIAFIVLAGAVWLLTPVVRAFAERIKSGEARARGGESEELRRLREDLSEDIQALRQEVAELTERLEFAERLLARQREPDRLPRGG